MREGPIHSSICGYYFLGTLSWRSCLCSKAGLGHLCYHRWLQLHGPRVPSSIWVCLVFPLACCWFPHHALWYDLRRGGCCRQHCSSVRTALAIQGLTLAHSCGEGTAALAGLHWVHSSSSNVAIWAPVKLFEVQNHTILAGTIWPPPIRAPDFLLLYFPGYEIKFILCTSGECGCFTCGYAMYHLCVCVWRGQRRRQIPRNWSCKQL